MAKHAPFIPGRTSYCCYCKRGPLIQGEKGSRNATGLMATRDHFVPIQETGPTDKGRWVPCCLTCNALKGALRPGPWLAFIDANPRYWKTFKDHRAVVRWLVDYNRVRRSRGWRSLVLYVEAPQAFVSFVNRA